MPDTTKQRTGEKERFHLALPEDRMERARSLANRRGTTLTELIRNSLTLMERVDEEVVEGHRIAVVDKRGNIVREILVPF